MIKLRRRDTDDLVAGHRSDTDPRLDDVDSFLDAMRSEFGATPAPEPRPTLASTLDGRRPLRPASGPRVHTTFPARRPRRRRLQPVAAFATAGIVLFGGLAGAGALPGPVQRTTADLGAHVGIHLPGRDVHPSARVEVDPGRIDSSPTTAVKPHASSGTTTPTVPTAPTTVAPVPTAPVSTPTVPTVPSLPLPVPTPTSTGGGGLAKLLSPVAPTGPTGPAGPTPSPPVRDLLDHLIP